MSCLTWQRAIGSQLPTVVPCCPASVRSDPCASSLPSVRISLTYTVSIAVTSRAPLRKSDSPCAPRMPRMPQRYPGHRARDRPANDPRSLCTHSVQGLSRSRSATAPFRSVAGRSARSAQVAERKQHLVCNPDLIGVRHSSALRSTLPFTVDSEVPRWVIARPVQ